jgi:hypothetical protein
MARVIVRYSLAAGDKAIRGRIRKGLRGSGFRHIGTSTFEAADLPLQDAVDAVKGVLDEVAAGELDNLWIYVDQPRDVAG